jgi:hypothetical protein
VNFKFDVFFLFSNGGILHMSLIARPFSPFICVDVTSGVLNFEYSVESVVAVGDPS